MEPMHSPLLNHIQLEPSVQGPPINRPELEDANLEAELTCSECMRSVVTVWVDYGLWNLGRT